ncbi:ATP-binding protein [Bacillus timonensis]|uniref:ATP-binding protein n=1 Tax=Bacillus timonensis TaxID=1033734 RepID=UPI000288B1C6|nr:ATP-binding protein [Bacillus timonensis]
MKIESQVLKNILVYLFIVILPTTVGSILFTNYHYQSFIKKQTTETEEMVQFHSSYIDRFIGETIAGTETLGIVLENKNSNEEIKNILVSIHKKDERFSGLYWANPEGDILVSSLGLDKKVNIGYREYFKQAIQTKRTVISPAHKGVVTGRFIVTIATPVLSSNEVEGVLLFSLRLDYLENVIKVLSPDEILRVVDYTGQELINTNQDFHSLDTDIIRTELDNVNWMIEARPRKTLTHKKEFILNSIIFSGIVLILTHILFLFGKYLLLKRQASREREENELQKLELVGTLAASTAHEIKNPLTGVKGLIQLLSEKHKDPTDQFYFSVIQQEITRINDIVNEFLILGKPTADKRKSYDINEIVKEVQPIIKSETNLYNIEFDLQLTSLPLYIMCSNDNIKQVVLNVAKNAIESMQKDGGHLTISIQKEENSCLLTIKDTGVGIPKKILAKVYHPFFTNKDTGTGLGLVICKRIVNMYNGTIEIDSIEGKGTTVQIRFPLHDE